MVAVIENESRLQKLTLNIRVKTKLDKSLEMIDESS